MVGNIAIESGKEIKNIAKDAKIKYI